MATVKNYKQELLIAGYVRKIEIVYNIINIPADIIDIIYLFHLFCNRWNEKYTHNDMLIDGTTNKITLNGDISFATAYGCNVIANGIHKWKIKVLSISYESGFKAYPCVGIIEDNEENLEKHVDNSHWEHIGYQFCAGNGMCFGMNDPNEQINTGLRWKTPNDVIEITLDLNQGTLQFAVNGNDPVIIWGKNGDNCIIKKDHIDWH